MGALGCKVSRCTEQLCDIGYDTPSHGISTQVDTHISSLIPLEDFHTFQAFCVLQWVSARRTWPCLSSPLPRIFSSHLTFILQTAPPCSGPHMADPYGLNQWVPLSPDFQLGCIHRRHWQEMQRWETIEDAVCIVPASSLPRCHGLAVLPPKGTAPVGAFPFSHPL